MRRTLWIAVFGALCSSCWFGFFGGGKDGAGGKNGASCGSDTDCADGLRCDDCARGSCDSCDDCVAACVPVH